MDFPTLGDGTFPHIDNVDVFKYKNDFDYSRFDADQAHITVCHVPWDVGLVHVGDRFIEGLGNVVRFADEAERNAYISGLSDKFEFDTKYRRYHLELEIKLPIPVDRCAEYNYVCVHHEPIPGASDPVEYESATEGVKDWFFFIRELKYLAPNTTYAVLMLDVWQTFIYRFGISGVMLERGHYPVSQSDTDAFLSDPMGNSAYLLDPDIDAPENMANASDDVHVFDDDVLFALFTSFDFAGSYGVKHQSGWNTPSIGIAGKSGFPSQTCIAVETSNAQSLLEYLQTYIPQSLGCIQACAFVPRELVEVSGTFVLGALTVYNLKSKKSTVTHELEREDFAYPEQYAELAKLYASPYANIVITDGANSITIAPQTVSGNSIEIITDLQLIADALRMRSQTVHVGGSNVTLGFERLTSKTFTASGSIQDLSILHDIPTYSIYVDNTIIYDNDNYWLNEQRKAEAAAQLADATDRATATKADAYASALASKDNAYASALASKDNAYASALASKDNAYASALASKDNTYASAQTANANAYEQAQAQNIIDLANAATVKADATANAYAVLNDTKDNADTAKTNADAAALADKQNADASAWAEQTNSNASALADKQNADSNAWAEQTNSNASALADYTNRNSSAFAIKTDADEEGNTKNANAALNTATNSYINGVNVVGSIGDCNLANSYGLISLQYDNGYTNDCTNASVQANIQNAVISGVSDTVASVATGAVAGSVIPGVGTVAGAIGGLVSAIPNAVEIAASTAVGVNLSVTQAGLATGHASSKFQNANHYSNLRTLNQNSISTDITTASNSLITDTTANEAALIQANAARDYACDIDNSQRTYDTEVANAGNVYSAETSNAQNTYDTLVNNATNTYSAETSNAQNTYNIRTQSNTRDNDTAHAIADRDYAVAIGIANRDNTTSVDNADLAKLTAESIADRSQATDKANADRSYAAAIANADRSYNAATANADRDYTTATANADRSYNAATANADRDYNTTIGIAQRDNAVELAAIDADVAQAALKAPYAVCAGSAQDAGAETPNYLDIQIRTMQPSDIRRIGDEFLRFGYAYHGYVADPDFTIMPRFTFWQCSEIFVSDLSIPDAYADQIRYLLIGGVTVWSDPSFIGNTSIYDNVIGG